jgi:hypothetical protein
MKLNLSDTGKSLKKVEFLLDKAKMGENSTDQKLSQVEINYLVDIITSLEKENLTKIEEEILYISLYCLARDWREDKEKILSDYFLGKKKFGYCSQILWMTTMYLLVVWQRFENDEYMERLIEILSANSKHPHPDDPDQYVRGITAKNAGEEYLKKFPKGKYSKIIQNCLKSQ